MQKVFVVFISAVMLISCIFYFFSHAPCKKNQSMKMAKIRKISTAFFAITTAITLVYTGQPKLMTIVLSYIIIHIAFDMAIKNL